LLSTLVPTVLDYTLAVLIWSILASALISILLMFDVLDRRNRFVWSVQDFLTRLTDPIIRPVRRRVPTFNGLDLSPWIVIVALQLVRSIVVPYFYAGIHFGTWQSLV
jgi:YggT family protein